MLSTVAEGGKDAHLNKFKNPIFGIEVIEIT